MTTAALAPAWRCSAETLLTVIGAFREFVLALLSHLNDFADVFRKLATTVHLPDFHFIDVCTGL